MASKRFQTSNCVDFHCESARQMHIMYLRLYCVACGRARKKGGSEPPASSRHRYWTDAGREASFVEIADAADVRYTCAASALPVVFEV